MGCGAERRGLSQYSSAVPGVALHDGMLQEGILRDQVFSGLTTCGEHSPCGAPNSGGDLSHVVKGIGESHC